MASMRLSALVVIAMLFLACDGGGGSQPRPTPFPTSTPTPAASETPQPTASPSPSPVSTEPPRRELKPKEVLFKPASSACVVEGDIATGIVTCQKSNATQILINQSGDLNKGIILERGQMLIIGKGVKVRSVTSDIPIRGKEETSVRGLGWDSVITESTQGGWEVIAGYYGTQENGRRDAFIQVRDLKIEGAEGKAFNSTPQAVALGNCVGCAMDNVWIDGTHSIGAQYGGASFFGYHALESSMTHCLFTRVASQSVACVNCDQVKFRDIYVIRPCQSGGPGCTSIDLEVNNADDRLTNVEVRDSYIDHRDSEVPTTGNGIQATNGDSQHVGNIVIENNLIIGGHINPAANWLSNGLYVFGTGAPAKGVTLRNNQIYRTGQSCIRAEGVNLTITGNKCDSTGGGGIPGFIAWVSNSTITSNTFSCTNGPCDGSLVLRGTGNRVEGNPGWAVVNQ